MAKRFQFSLWNMLAMFFWVSMWLGACSVLYTHFFDIINAELPLWGRAAILAMMCAAIVAIPFLAAGALLGRTGRFGEHAILAALSAASYFVVPFLLFGLFWVVQKLVGIW